MTLPHFVFGAWPARLLTALLWAAAAASLMYWGLRLAAPADSTRPPAAAMGTAAAWGGDSAAVGRALGVQPAVQSAVPQADVAARFRLIGIVAGDWGVAGAALVAVDGKPARPYRVGAVVGEDYVLKSLEVRSAQFVLRGSETVQAFVLDLPLKPMAVNDPPKPVPAAR